MYDLPYFKEADHQRILDFMRAHPFAFITGCDATNKPVATQVPVLIKQTEGKLFLVGHLMKQTDHHKALEANPHVLIVFTGAHAYVSASWYTDQQTASTWNYMSVHARGVMRFLDEAALLDILHHTTNYFESNPSSPSNFEKLPRDYVDKLSKAIVAFEVEVESLQNVFKLSQNKNEKSYSNIIDQLEQQDKNGEVIAAEMKIRKEELFK